jgi:hypothetical protein
MKWTVVWIMLWGWSFTSDAIIVRAKGFIVSSSLALKTFSTSHVGREDLVD